MGRTSALDSGRDPRAECCAFAETEDASETGGKDLDPPGVGKSEREHRKKENGSVTGTGGSHGSGNGADGTEGAFAGGRRRAEAREGADRGCDQEFSRAGPGT